MLSLRLFPMVRLRRAMAFRGLCSAGTSRFQSCCVWARGRRLTGLRPLIGRVFPAVFFRNGTKNLRLLFRSYLTVVRGNTKSVISEGSASSFPFFLHCQLLLAGSPSHHLSVTLQGSRGSLFFCTSILNLRYPDILSDDSRTSTGSSPTISDKTYATACLSHPCRFSVTNSLPSSTFFLSPDIFRYAHPVKSFLSTVLTGFKR